MKNQRILFYWFLTLLILSCSKEINENTAPPVDPPIDTPVDIPIEGPFNHEINYTLNPSGYSPLVAEIDIKTNKEVTVTTRLIGKYGDISDLSRKYNDLDSAFNFITCGFYSDYENILEFTFKDENNSPLLIDSISIITDPGHVKLPEITVENFNSSKLGDEMYILNYFGHVGERYPNMPLIFDKYGEVRWYLDYEGHPDLSELFYDVGLSKIKNGNWLFGNGMDSELYEVDMTGAIINNWDLGGYTFHHQVIEKPDGNFLFTARIRNRPTRDDAIIEVARDGSGIVKVWDMLDIIDQDRDTWIGGNDWFHGNGLAYSEADDCIIVSGRHQGVFKINYNDELQWILAPHKDWDKVLNGKALSESLLQPIDNLDDPIDDEDLKKGDTNHPDFSWSWFQHSPIIKPNGNLMIFDNGTRRNYSFSNPLYSRAVEYEINEESKSIKQIWDYGQTRGEAMYCQFVSSVRYYDENQHVLIGAGGLTFDDDNYGRVIELDQNSSEVVFEAKIKANKAFNIIVFHNVAKVDINNY